MKTCPKCGGKKVIMVEYDLMSKHHYDGVSEYRCLNPECGYRQGRWCEQELTNTEMEPQFCQGRAHPRSIPLNDE